MDLAPAQDLSKREPSGLLFFKDTPAETRGHTTEFFAARIRNPHTRAAYIQGVRRFVSFCEASALGLLDIKPLHVAAWVDTHTGSPATVRLHLAGVRQYFSHLTVAGILAH